MDYKYHLFLLYMPRYAFLGPMASGKSWTAAKMMESLECEKLSFADPVKAIAREHFGMTTKDRKLLQTIGLTGRVLDPDVWVNKLLSQVKEGGSYVVDDVRYPNELLALKNLGFITVWLETSKEERIRRLKSTYGVKDSVQHIQNMSDESEHSVHSSMADIVWTNPDARVSELVEFYSNEI